MGGVGAWVILMSTPGPIPLTLDWTDLGMDLTWSSTKINVLALKTWKVEGRHELFVEAFYDTLL